MSREDYLFIGEYWHNVESAQLNSMTSEIESVDSNRLLNTSIEDLAVYFEQKFKIEVPTLLIKDLVVDSREARVDVSRNPNYWEQDAESPRYAKGLEVVVEIPFEGDAAAFNIRPNPHSLNPPRARIDGSVVRFNFLGADLSESYLRTEIDQTLSDIQCLLTNLRSNVSIFNGGLLNLVRSAIESRRSKLLAGRSMVASLGFKMKERPGALKTFAAPEIRRAIRPSMPTASLAPFKPEPVLAGDDYEHILRVMANMARVMELSPSAFRDADEETLRSHFLVQLNGHYQGQATGETFNYEGKTDILIRSEGRNIFIAECKFWSGPKGLEETVDQLLGYSSWRDTKTAVVIFNRNKDFSRVLDQIPGVARSHPGFKRDHAESSESNFRYVFSNKDDRNREMLLTILAFDVPA